MNLIRLSIDRPVAVISAVLMVVMFGILALTVIPIQLTPDVRKPVISLQTIWPAHQAKSSRVNSPRSTPSPLAGRAGQSGHLPHPAA